MFGFKEKAPTAREMKVINRFRDADAFAEYATSSGFMKFGDWDDRDEYQDAYEDAVEFWKKYHEK